MGQGIARLKAEKKPAARDVPICTDPALVDKMQRIGGKLNRARRRLDATSDGQDTAQLEVEILDLEAELEEAELEAKSHSETLEIRAIAPAAYDAMLDRFGPTKEQEKENRRKNGPKASLQWDPDRFPYYLIAACTHVVTFGPENPETGRVEREYEQLPISFVWDMAGLNPENGEPWTEATLEKAGLDEEPQPQWSAGEIQRIFMHCLTINNDSSQINAAGND
jgi:hypothetical protein